MSAFGGAAILGIVGAAICLLILVEPDWAAIRSGFTRSIGRRLAVERVREDLAQAGLRWLSVGTWLSLRVAASLVAGLIAYAAFGVLVLGLVGCLACYHLIGLVLEHQRRRRQLERQQALLEAVRYGAAIMARGGNASDMLRALVKSGPPLARPIFAELGERPDDDQAEYSLPNRVASLRDRLAEPLFDDVALALILHWRRGAKLVPALDAIVQEWVESVRLQRDARVMRAGVEASVLILTVLPIVFLSFVQLLGPELLQPFRSAPGQALLGLAVLWMVLGYRVMQQMSEPPREERLRLKGVEP